jgi:hypothetical protein
LVWVWALVVVVVLLLLLAVPAWLLVLALVYARIEILETLRQSEVFQDRVGPVALTPVRVAAVAGEEAV